MIYDVSVHASLNGRAKQEFADNPALFSHQVLLAEQLLGLPLTPKLGRDGQLLALAIVLQVNFQYQYGVDPQVFDTRSSHVQRESTRFKNPAPLIDPRARQIVDDVLGIEAGSAARFGPGIPSLRGPNV